MCIRDSVKAAEKPAPPQIPATQTLATEQLNKTLSSLTKSIETIAITSTEQTEVTGKLAEAVAKKPIVQRLIEPQSQVFAGKLRAPVQATTPTIDLHQEIDILKAAVEMIPSAAPSNKPLVKLALETATINKSATEARIERQAKPTATSKPNTDVVLSTETRPEKPTVETLRAANNRIAEFLVSQNRPVRRRSAV